MRISFDFDGVLSEQKIQNLATLLKQTDAEVFIITTRMPLMTDDLKTVAKNLNFAVDNIYFTNGELKYLKTKELAIDLHFDDDPNEVYLMQQNGILAVLVSLDVVILDRFLQKIKQ
ncbi:MAG: hypothetical protein MUE85_14725 [Microscillaceae bacterium]|jgi:hypothetical protein|nr:hypothetical protein [Microscillaceae bacterium]